MSKRILCLVIAIVLALGGGINALAASKTEVQKQQTETRERLNEVNKSISAMEKKQEEVRSELKNLDAELVETMLTLEILEADIESKQQEIEKAQEEYEYFKALEEKQYGAMKRRIQCLYEKSDTDYITILLEAKSISDLLNRVSFAKDIYDYDDRKLTEYQETKIKVEETRIRLEDEQLELLEVQEDQKVYKESLDNQIAEKKSKIKDFEAELANAKEKVKEYQKTIKEQSQKIKELEEEERKEQENSGSGGSGSSGGSSSGGTYKPSGSGTGTDIANYALQFVGNPYVYGGNSLTNGIDCSGFTRAVHLHFGISIPRQSTAQSYGGQKVSLSALQPGDIIYYGNHVAIYIGGSKVVHASNERDGIKISSYTYRTPIRACRYW